MRGPTYWLVRVIQWASTIACLILIASFAVFAVNKTSAASNHQAGQIRGEPSAVPGAPTNPATTAGQVAPTTAGPTPVSARSKQAPFHRVLDEAGETLRSPFSSVTSSSHSEWTVQLVGTLLALFVYGFALRFLARSLGAGLRAA